MPSNSLVSPFLKRKLIILCEIIIFLIVFNSFIGSVKSEKNKKPKCTLCKDLIDDFIAGLKKTSKGNFGGGNTDWEDRKLGNYLYSETRFEEILEGICKSDSQCHQLLEEQEDQLFDWFKNKQAEIESNLFSSICIVKAKACCGENQYGPQCKPCLLNWGSVCSGNGHCQGSGTRSGTGKCICNYGFSGELCDKCGSGFYETERNDSFVKCDGCHNSCAKCSGPGAEECEECKEGWKMSDETKLCEDINECLVKEKACQNREFCENSIGSYTCYECDPACKTGCSGKGADKCIGECSSGYRALTTSEAMQCIDVNECEEAAASGKSVCAEKLKCVNTIGGYECVVPEYEADLVKANEVAANKSNPKKIADQKSAANEEDDIQVVDEDESEESTLKLNPANLKTDL